ncbi:hypothetical protein AB0F17_63670 [Nonomuraea sp. NPDC026600]
MREAFGVGRVGGGQDGGALVADGVGASVVDVDGVLVLDPGTRLVARD